MKIVSIVGARPQFVKAAVLSRKISENTNWEEVMVHTGQHFDANMSAVFFEEMSIPAPQYFLGIDSLTREEMIAQMQTEIEKVLQKENPDWVLVYGDTNSTLAGAKAAKANGIKLAHVEAGLRSFDKQMPEELNRIATDELSDLLLVPSNKATANLQLENIQALDNGVVEVGDIMHDALLFYLKKIQHQTISKPKAPFVLLTLHRAANTDSKEVLTRILKAIDNITKEVEVIFPVHPRTRKKMEEWNLSTHATLMEPVGYFQMLNYLQQADLVLTDSGGLQKEAFYVNKFCITLRENTEWTELLDLGVNVLCGSDGAKIAQAYSNFSNRRFGEYPQVYGDGNTAEKIILALNNF